MEKRAAGLFAIAAGVGGYAEHLPLSARINEICQFFNKPLFLSGKMTRVKNFTSSSNKVDCSYISPPFAATYEANARQEYKCMKDTSNSDV